MSVTISLPKIVIEHARKKAKELGISIEEYFLELISQELDPREKYRVH